MNCPTLEEKEPLVEMVAVIFDDTAIYTARLKTGRDIEHIS